MQYVRWSKSHVPQGETRRDVAGSLEMFELGETGWPVAGKWVRLPRLYNAPDDHNWRTSM